MKARTDYAITIFKIIMFLIFLYAFSRPVINDLDIPPTEYNHVR